MDLITDDEQVMIVAEVSQAYERLTRPADTAGIVRIAKDKHTTFVVTDTLQTVKVHSVIVTGLHMLFLQSLGVNLQRVPHDLTLVGARHEEERMVDGRHDDDLLIGFAKEVTDDADAFDDAGDETDPLRLDIPLVMLAHPINDCRTIVCRLHGIAKDRMLKAFLHGLNDIGQYGKIHVGHPHRLEVITAPAREQCLVHEVTAALTFYDG